MKRFFLSFGQRLLLCPVWPLLLDIFRQRLSLRCSYRNRDSLPMKSFVSQLQVINITSVTM